MNSKIIAAIITVVAIACGIWLDIMTLKVLATIALGMDAGAYLRKVMDKEADDNG